MDRGAKLTYRERLERDAWLAYARSAIERAEQEPTRVYLGEGIWWAPSQGFINSCLGRTALNQNGRAHHG